ncbi:MAG: helix-turn-helix domain-containing protein [Ruminococcus sp.]|nr:helix-turn-helix domain-containing protein [Ruminococcus sp.]MCM1380567.1 helix-turn-helix domain-containing protein [Muribaculaceae bacterium]MCM1480752.1 helix-turn-helix domain-containing protein [Muribaculaceae bacterium]
MMINIKTAREKSGKKQQECANILGVTLRAWQGYEQGIREPKFELLIKIADMFGVTTDYLLGREPLPNPLAGCGKDEAAVIEKYLSLPSDTRKCALDVLRQLGETLQIPPQDNKK